jgi:hypothetical protein
MKALSKVIGLAAAFTVVIAGTAPIASASALVDFTGGQVETNNNNETYGYSFTVSGSSFSVDGLGVFDSFSTPLALSHAVGLWDSAGNLIASTTIGPSDTPVASTDAFGQWLEASITPVILTPGQYFAGVFYLVGTEDVLVLGTPNSVAGISYDSAQYNFGGSLAFPDSSFGTTLVGPAVLGTSFGTSVPEPITLSLFGAGLAGAVAMRRRKKTV